MFRTWAPVGWVSQAASTLIERSRRTVHYPKLRKDHPHLFISKFSPQGSNYSHLLGPGALTNLTAFMLGPQDVLGLEFGTYGRDRGIQEAFLNINRCDRVLTINGLRPELCIPGGSTLLDSLIVEGRSSRYKVPTLLHLESLQDHRAVDRTTLDKV